MKKARPTQNAASNAGEAAHRAKAATQTSQLRGAGATLGGFATGKAPASVMPNMGKFKSRGKR